MQEGRLWQAIGLGLMAAAATGGAIMAFSIGARPEHVVGLSTDLGLGFLFLAGVVNLAAGRVINSLNSGFKAGEAKCWARLAVVLCLAGLVTLGIVWMRLNNLTPTINQIFLGFVASCALLSGIVLSAASRMMAAGGRAAQGKPADA